MHRPGRCGVGKFFDRVDSAAPDGGRALVIASGRDLVGHVVRAIGVIAQVDHGGMAPAFSGGISLSKRCELINRFSEDIDFKCASRPQAAPVAPSANAPLIGNGYSRR
jgi:hypothetical protein